jgi:GNAT superfamily N-acetyltransferase
MSSIEISQVNSKTDRDAFIKFPWEIYRNDPAWVPPLLLERKEFLDRKKHPFYEHGDAALFLARAQGKIVGRIIASDDPNYNRHHKSNVGCFGLFESVNDQEVAAALIEAAANWVQAKGRTEIMGPIDYSTNYVCGLVIDGFEHPPTLLTPHNPPYYLQLLEGLGFVKVIDWYAWWFDQPDRAMLRLRRLAASLKERHPVSIRCVNLRDFAAEAARIREVYNAAWKDNWGFVPFTEREFQALAKELKPIVVPEGALIAEIGAEPVGFIIGVPDINVALQKINGRLTTFGIPIGLAKLLYYKNRIRKGRLVALGIKPEYRRGGIAERLVLQVMEEGMLKRGFTTELSMTLENNHLINRFLKAIGARIYKRYRIYRRALS